MNMLWLVYLTWTTPPLVPRSEDRDHRIHTRMQPTTLIISLNDVKCPPKKARPTGRDRTGGSL